MAACARGGDGTYGGAAVAGEPRKLPKGACTAVPDNTDSSDTDSSDTGSGSSLGTETDILAIHSKTGGGTRARAQALRRRKKCEPEKASLGRIRIKKRVPMAAQRRRVASAMAVTSQETWHQLVTSWSPAGQLVPAAAASVDAPRRAFQ